MTDPDLPSGSDRVLAAVTSVDPDGAHDVVINLQGDLPAIAPAAIAAVLDPLGDPAVDIATLVAPIGDPAERDDPNVVKAALDFGASDQRQGRTARALYFSRAAVPSGEGPLYHHIGIYAFRRAALKRFVALPPSGLEKRERLEQLRALEAGMRIDAALIDDVPLGVDTEADLAKARSLLA
jgi:3-deoxy-manno-octulosonate cytidylyltransferase (CMP-KDO synthetase)